MKPSNGREPKREGQFAQHHAPPHHQRNFYAKNAILYAKVGSPSHPSWRDLERTAARTYHFSASLDQSRSTLYGVVLKIPPPGPAIAVLLHPRSHRCSCPLTGSSRIAVSPSRVKAARWGTGQGRVGGGRVRSAFSRNCRQVMLGTGISVGTPSGPKARAGGARNSAVQRAICHPAVVLWFRSSAGGDHARHQAARVHHAPRWRRVVAARRARSSPRCR
jgi:hypothetical protein